MNSKQLHSFHIPVMGIGFTIDTPVKVAHLGISSVISLVDDILIEKMREFYCNKLNIPFNSIKDTAEDSRAKRITAYLNLIQKIVNENFKDFIELVVEHPDEIEKFLNILPGSSPVKLMLKEFSGRNYSKNYLKNRLLEKLTPGSIDVNIMTKLDRQKYRKNDILPVKFNDAHAALRGFANSKLESSIILSAGLNPRLYSYIEKFDDFFPDESGNIKKKIVLKVSDYRSAIIQGKFLAKKGLWVSEYRIESGLNCGGHAFTSDGFLMGPILDEFRLCKDDLIDVTHSIFMEALKRNNRFYPDKPIDVRITAQGGVGTSDEHQFILDYYQLDSVGWGTPFLLVPEATNVDPHTRQMLIEAREDDLYLSKISPLGVPFNSLRNNTKDIEKLKLAQKGRPGSSCPRKFIEYNTDFTEKPICTASRQYQDLKLKELNSSNLHPDDHSKKTDAVIEKSCLCTGLGTSVLINNDLNTRIEGNGVSVCPGPNMAYFSKVVSLSEMVNHIYGRCNIISRDDRPNMFLKELSLYINYFKEKIGESTKPYSDKQIRYFETFKQNMDDGIEYYKNLFSNVKTIFEHTKSNLLDELKILEDEFGKLCLELFVEAESEPVFVNAV